MKLTSPGYRSQLIFTDFDGASFDRGDHVAIHSPKNPTYFWGNLLIFDRAPRKGDAKKWRELFAKEFTNPEIYHQTFAWQSNDKPELTEFEQLGFKLETTTVLTAEDVFLPPKYNAELEVRPITQDEWPEMIELQLSTSQPHLTKDAWREFYSNQAKRYQKMEEADFGNWWGGYINDQLVAGLGLYYRNGVARFQNVSTHADHLRKGYCQTLVYEVSKKTPKHTLVMCADPDYHAIKIYESVGFQKTATEQGVSWFDPVKAKGGRA